MLTEIISNDSFLTLEAEEIVAALATFIEEKSVDVTTLDGLDVPKKVKSILNDINYLAEDFGDYENQCH